MLLTDWFKWVFHAVTNARLRSLLTALGISIGIAAVTLLTSIGEGIRGYMMDSFSQFGTRIIAITPGKVDTSGVPNLLTTIRPLSLEDAEALTHLPHVDAVVPLIQGTAKIEGDKYSRDTDVYGVGPDMDTAWKFRVATGRFLPDDDLENSRYFTVLGAKVRTPTLSGAVNLTIPPNTSSGKAMRLKGKGLPNKNDGHGDLLVKPQIIMPHHSDEELETLMKAWKEITPYRARGPEFD